jgi:hypothetical protein
MSPPKPSKLAVSPNPFPRSVCIDFHLDRASQTELRIYDILGRPVETILDGFIPPGDHHITWQPKIPEGVYFLRFDDGDYTEVKKLLYTRAKIRR